MAAINSPTGAIRSPTWRKSLRGMTGQDVDIPHSWVGVQAAGGWAGSNGAKPPVPSHLRWANEQLDSCPQRMQGGAATRA